MKKYWVMVDNSDNTKYAVVGASRRPAAAICEAPAGATTADGDYITVAPDAKNPEKMVATLDLVAKQADQDAKDAAVAAVQYREDRQKAYPPIGDQLDALYKRDHLNDSSDWDAICAQITAVKAAFPKPE